MKKDKNIQFSNCISADKKSHEENLNKLNEPQHEYVGFLNKSEDEKLRDDVLRSPIEKLQLFTKMLHRESVLKRAKIYRT